MSNGTKTMALKWTLAILGSVASAWAIFLWGPSTNDSVGIYSNEDAIVIKNEGTTTIQEHRLVVQFLTSKKYEIQSPVPMPSIGCYLNDVRYEVLIEPLQNAWANYYCDQPFFPGESRSISKSPFDGSILSISFHSESTSIEKHSPL